MSSYASSGSNTWEMCRFKIGRGEVSGVKGDSVSRPFKDLIEGHV